MPTLKFRVLSTFGIVWFHSGVFGHDFAFTGLIVFLILSDVFGWWVVALRMFNSSSQAGALSCLGFGAV